MFTIGQGICSWVCFYGGIDEAFSKILKRPLIKLNIGKKWRDLPLAFLIFLLIISFLQGLPVFCNWFCPFKMTTAFCAGSPAIKTIQIALFVISLSVFVIALPMLTKKRTFCSMVCPFGALASICGKASPYRVTLDNVKCIHCGKCREACPVLAVEKSGQDVYSISSYCNRCGKCIDICPVDAIDVTAMNKITGMRDIYIFLALLITGAVSGSFVPRVFLQLIGIR